ncbi:MAG: hypothetical protein HGA45_33625 [Chloroflexales bacterium]|nr:hypothetical protein [Chloroflexales bacterium]
MMEIVLQLLLISIWGALGTMHTRRLFRLATVPVMLERRRHLRARAQRIWWLLGRDEFLALLQRDTLRCIELTLMLALIALSL